jgi:hypothetical protein
MVRRIAAAAAACCAALASGAAAEAAGAAIVRAREGVAPQVFGIPGVYGISAWGSYLRTGSRVRVTVCVTDTARDVYGGEAAGVASNGGYTRRRGISTVVIGYGHTSCVTMTTGCTSHLVVDALSGYRNGKVRQAGKLRRVY